MIIVQMALISNKHHLKMNIMHKGKICVNICMHDDVYV